MEKKFSWKAEAKKNLVDYFSETTVHGFRYIVEGRNILERLVWFLVVVFGQLLRRDDMLLVRCPQLSRVADVMPR